MGFPNPNTGEPRESIIGIRESAETGQDFSENIFGGKVVLPCVQRAERLREPLIESNLRGCFESIRSPGAARSIRSLFHRQYVDKVAVAGADFSVGEGEIVGSRCQWRRKNNARQNALWNRPPHLGEARVLGYNPWEKHNDLRRQISLIMGQNPFGGISLGRIALNCFGRSIRSTEYESNLKRLTEMLQVEDELSTQIRRLSLGSA